MLRRSSRRDQLRRCKLGSLELLFDEQVGRGAFATVWRAKDTLGRLVAVKFFSDRTASQVEAQALAHAQALSRVNHPAVVRVLAVEPHPHPETGEEKLAIVMELVPGTSLSLLPGALDATLGQRVLADLAGGLQAIHDAGLVHGDLHSANVIIHERGATLVDIFYTHSLAEVGTRTATRTRAEDLRELARVCRELCARCLPENDALADAYFKAASAGSITEVTRYFDDLFERPVAPSVQRRSTPPDDLLRLFEAVHVASKPLSPTVAALLVVAKRLGDAPLAQLCEAELSGYRTSTQTAAGDAMAPDDDHRVLQMMISYGAALNGQAFSTGSAALAYMAARPKQFLEVKFLYPDALSEIERFIARGDGAGLVQITMSAGLLVPQTANPEAPVYAYTSADELVALVERVRARLSLHLLRLINGEARQGNS